MRGRPGTWWDAFLWRLILRMPRILIENPERLLLKLALVIVGCTTAFQHPQPATVAAVAPPLLRYQWSFLLGVGGILAIIGMLRRYGSIERLGVAMTALGCYLFAGAALLLLPRGIVQAVIFTCIGGASTIRLLVSAGARRTLRQANEGWPL